jgi:hypothetical protein
MVNAIPERSRTQMRERLNLSDGTGMVLARFEGYNEGISRSPGLTPQRAFGDLAPSGGGWLTPRPIVWRLAPAAWRAKIIDEIRSTLRTWIHRTLELRRTHPLTRQRDQSILKPVLNRAHSTILVALFGCLVWQCSAADRERLITFEPIGSADRPGMRY